MNATAQVHLLYDLTQPSIIIAAIHERAFRERRNLSMNDAERIIEQVHRARHLMKYAPTPKKRKRR